MKFNVDKSTITEGDIVEVTWDCTGADNVSLYIDNGFKKSNIPLELMGSKRFRLNRSKGKTIITIEAEVKGKKHHAQAKVKVKPIAVTQSETVYENGKSGFWQGLKYKFKNMFSNLRLKWSHLPHKKKVALAILLGILVVALLSPLLPVLFGIGIILLIVYLVIVLLRRN